MTLVEAHEAALERGLTPSEAVRCGGLARTHAHARDGARLPRSRHARWTTSARRRRRGGVRACRSRRRVQEARRVMKPGACSRAPSSRPRAIAAVTRRPQALVGSTSSARNVSAPGRGGASSETSKEMLRRDAVASREEGAVYRAVRRLHRHRMIANLAGRVLFARARRRSRSTVVAGLGLAMAFRHVRPGRQTTSSRTCQARRADLPHFFVSYAVADRCSAGRRVRRPGRLLRTRRARTPRQTPW